MDVFKDRRSCYFPIAVEPITFIGRHTVPYMVDYILSIHCSTKNSRGQIQDFIEWIMPYVEHCGSTEDIICLGYWQEYGKQPEFICLR